MIHTFTPRPSQQNILRYTGGRLGIAAVPGAGKTHILSALAAKIIHEGWLGDDQEVLIVTLVNSAVDNFETRIKRFFDNPLHALYKYRVRTLHGLAHDIVREKPARVGLDERFSIIDDSESQRIIDDATRAWMDANQEVVDSYISSEIELNKRDWIRRDKFPQIASGVAKAFIRTAKDKRLSPEFIQSRLDSHPAQLYLAKMGSDVYNAYQRALAYRSAVDFDDLVKYSLDILESDVEFCERLRHRYPYVLEDEAQDSSKIQQQVLEALTGKGGNWVRVGDPNQAIFETFTTASPKHLLDFIATADQRNDLPESGRSQPAIIDLANHLVEWTMHNHPVIDVRDALVAPPYIKPVTEGDQQNPEYDRNAIHFSKKKYTGDEEITAVVKSIKKWLPENPDKTVAVLSSINDHAAKIVEELRKNGIDVVELLKSTSETRAAAGSLSYLLSYLADPGSARKLSKAYEVWRRDVFGSNRRGDPSGSNGESDEGVAGRPYIEQIPALLRKMADVENFVAPQNANDWLAGLAESEAMQVIEGLSAFRVTVQRWLNAVTLPIDQLMLTLAQDVFSEASDLALAHKLALVLRGAADDHADWRLPELTAELAVIAKNERRFIGFSSDDSGFDPERHRGRVVVTTMHKAKGLEWDRVYMMSVNNYDFPSNMPNDRFISEKWFVRSGLDLAAESLAQLSVLESSSEYDWYEEGAATMRSRLDYVKERLRLFYVGITRAKRGLIVTWNSGRQGDATPSLALSELMGWWEGKDSD
jgi:DNA helicase II / ATP-dependent DNA helicase PcrA